MYSTVDAFVKQRREEELSKHGPHMSVVLCCSFTQTLKLLGSIDFLVLAGNGSTTTTSTQILREKNLNRQRVDKDHTRL